MAQCPSCNKFPSLETADPEIDEGDIVIDNYGDGSFSISGDVRLVRTSACCGEEMKEAIISFEAEADHVCPKEDTEEKTADQRYFVQSVEASTTERSQDTDRKGKKIKSYRYMKTFIGADVYVTVRCSWCGEDIGVSTSVEEQASGFEELV